MKRLLKKLLFGLYAILPFKKQALALLRSVYVPSPAIYHRLHFDGAFRVKLPGGRSFRMRHYGFYIENEVFWHGIYGNWEKTSLRIWGEFSARSQTIVDVGANTGVYALLSQALNPQAKVMAVEPIGRVYRKLAENVRLNGFDILCVEKGASNYDGEATIYDASEEHTYSATLNRDVSIYGEEALPVSIPVARLDTLLEETGFTALDLLKIDVESYEPEVLEGFQAGLAKHTPVMFIEILEDEVGARIEKLVEGLGYVYFNIDEKGGKVMRVERLAGKRGEKGAVINYNYLLCTPERGKGIGSLQGHF